jgi:hypothetical protein
MRVTPQPESRFGYNRGKEGDAMPIHNWTPDYAWLFHDFRHGWLSELGRELNKRVLPSGYYALTERWADGFDLDEYQNESFTSPTAIVAAASHRLPKADDLFAENRPHRAITIRREQDDRLVAACDLVPPDYRSGTVDVPANAARIAGLVMRGIHLLLVDLYSPARKEVHRAVWNRLKRVPAIPGDKPLSLASYESGETISAYIEPVAVGDALPDMPLFLMPGGHVLVPLEKTYMSAWEGVPARWRKVIDPKSN